VINGKNGGDDSVDGEKVKDQMWMRLTERMREFIRKVGCCMLKRTVCNSRDEEVGGLEMVTTRKVL